MGGARLDVVEHVRMALSGSLSMFPPRRNNRPVARGDDLPNLEQHIEVPTELQRRLPVPLDGVADEPVELSSRLHGELLCRVGARVGTPGTGLVDISRCVGC